MKVARRLEKAMRRPLPDGKKGEKDRQPDPRFPRAGHPGRKTEKTLLSDALDSVPDEEIGRHLFWLSEKLGRTPFE